MKQRTMITLGLAVLILLALVGCGGGEETEWDRISNEGTIVVGTSADYPPFEYIDENNEFAGFDIELMEEIARRLDLTIEWQDIGFDGLIGSLQTGKIDAIIAAMSATPERQEQVDFTRPYYIGKDAALIASGSDLVINSKDDLIGLRLGVQTGTIQDGWATENLDAANIARYERAEQAVADLRAGRIDAVAMDFFAATAFLAQGGVDLALETNFADEHMSIAVRNGATELSEQLDAVIAELQDEGFIDNLVIEYLLEE